MTALQVDLRHVAGYHGLCADADAREEHLHLLGRSVLRLIKDDESVIQCASAHVGERGDFDGATLKELGHLVKTHQVIQCVVERAQVRVDLLREVAGQKAEPLTGFDRRAGEYDALHQFALYRIDR